MNSKLKPCPECGNNDGYISIATDYHCVHKIYSVCCANCSFHTVEFASENEAVENWNRTAINIKAEKRKKVFAYFARNYIKPCPFCGYEARVIEQEESGYKNFYVLCNHCGCRTMNFASEFEAINIWNVRTGG